MIRLQLKVTYDDGRTVEVTVKPKSFVALERQYGIAMGELEGNVRYEYLAYLAWSSLHFTGQEPASFDDWLSVLSEVSEMANDAAPFPQGQPDDSSAGSQ